jgi:hypothetical protein
MLRDGFAVMGMDGKVDQGGFPDDFPFPPTIHGVRPDACGFKGGDELVGFVEAKTEGDIDNAHTRVQLGTLASLRMPLNGEPCPVYIVIPRAAAYALDRVLISLGLLRARHIRRVHVPSIFLET